MKLYVHSILASFSVLCASLCGCPEDDYVPPVTYEVQQNQLVFVDGDRFNYAVGDTLWLNVQVPQRVIDEITGQSYDIFEITGATEARISLKLEKESSFTKPFLVNFSQEDLVLEAGVFQIPEFETTQLALDVNYQDDAYRLRIGFLLKEAGVYQLSGFYGNDWQFGFYDTDFGKLPQEYVFVTTTVRGAANGALRFTVVE
ncbi:Hypothetical protein I595_2213 [Croceitalea dokdonensis DOKDO 023]|uniref:Uncharacterized protein n=1 Tax=Croceitalea dokdonensis DOKDO 023 TaxID=1300341 RepID=A0A0P7AV01_9FLAO|nr:hypothetical protein [Croceitalea dokdonensis]KPM31718.1 Hypothetical protein I595_2213 [Croceitalea dokdonensis DOKDO 023]